MKVAIYARISTTNKGQDADNQVMILREYCNKMDYQIYQEYCDEISGGTSERPQFKAMFNDPFRYFQESFNQYHDSREDVKVN